jgi:hypothetical protein
VGVNPEPMKIDYKQGPPLSNALLHFYFVFMRAPLLNPYQKLGELPKDVVVVAGRVSADGGSMESRRW